MLQSNKPSKTYH